MSSTAASTESERGGAGARVGFGTSRATVIRRRRSVLATGAWSATSSSGGAQARSVRRQYRSRGRGKSGAGGSPAHQELDGGVGEAGEDRAATSSSSNTAAGARGDDDDSRGIDRPGSIPSSGRMRRPRRSLLQHQIGLWRGETLAIHVGGELRFRARGGIRPGLFVPPEQSSGWWWTPPS